jgi:hypothetical protein
MPVYEYACPRGHVTEKFVSLSERPQFIDCEGGASDSPCLHQAERIVSAPKTTFHANDRKAIKREGR